VDPPPPLLLCGELAGVCRPPWLLDDFFLELPDPVDPVPVDPVPVDPVPEPEVDPLLGLGLLDELLPVLFTAA
jgi:hypothetical protein